MIDKRVNGVNVNMFDLDVKSKRPKYEQIIEKIKIDNNEKSMILKLLIML